MILPRRTLDRISLHFPAKLRPAVRLPWSWQARKQKAITFHEESQSIMARFNFSASSFLKIGLRLAEEEYDTGAPPRTGIPHALERLHEARIRWHTTKNHLCLARVTALKERIGKNSVIVSNMEQGSNTFHDDNISTVFKEHSSSRYTVDNFTWVQRADAVIHAKRRLMPNVSKWDPVSVSKLFHEPSTVEIKRNTFCLRTIETCFFCAREALL